MKQFGIYIAVGLLAASCANQGDLAQYDDDGIYTASASEKSGSSADAKDAYYFVDEDPNASGSDQRYYGSEEGDPEQRDLATTDDYVPEAKSLPSESGRAYSNQRYNSPTAHSAYASSVPITMRMGYSSFHNPAFGGGGFGMSVGYGYGYNNMNPWWGYYDPWNPWCRWNRWNRWNNWYAWNAWSPYGPYGMGYNSGFAMGYHYGVNSNNWNNSYYAGDANNNTYNGPRPGYTGGSFTNSTGQIQPRGDRSRTLSRGDQTRPDRDGVRSRTPDQRPASRTPRYDGYQRPSNPDATRTPSRDDNSNKRPGIRWNNGSRTPDFNRPGGNSKPNSGYTPRGRNNSSPSTRPSRSPSNNNFSRPSKPSRSPSKTTPSSPSRGSGGSSGGNSRGGFKR